MNSPTYWQDISIAGQVSNPTQSKRPPSHPPTSESQVEPHPPFQHRADFTSIPARGQHHNTGNTPAISPPTTKQCIEGSYPSSSQHPQVSRVIKLPQVGQYHWQDTFCPRGIPHFSTADNSKVSPTK